MTGKCVCTKKYKNSYFPSRVKIIHVFISHHEKTFYSYTVTGKMFYTYPITRKHFFHIPSQEKCFIHIPSQDFFLIFIPSRKMIIIIHIPSRESIRFICHLRKMFKFTTHHGKVSYSYPYRKFFMFISHHGKIKHIINLLI